jgi:hypothetical protein
MDCNVWAVHCLVQRRVCPAKQEVLCSEKLQGQWSLPAPSMLNCAVNALPASASHHAPNTHIQMVARSDHRNKQTGQARYMLWDTELSAHSVAVISLTRAVNEHKRLVMALAAQGVLRMRQLLAASMRRRGPVTECGGHSNCRVSTPQYAEVPRERMVMTPCDTRHAISIA